MRIAVILSRVPFPLEKGDKLRAYHQIKALSQSHHVEVHCISPKSIPQETIDAVESICAKIHIHRLPKFQSFINLFLALLLLIGT